MRHTNILFAVLLGSLLCPAFESSAQKEITFGSTDSRSGHKRHSRYARGGDAKNSITIGLASWLNGYTPVYYERAVISAISIQAGIGFTSRPFTAEFGTFSNEAGASTTFNGVNSIDVADNFGEYKFRKSVPGIYLSISPKVYYTDDVMDGPFIAPMLEYKQFRWNAQKADETAVVTTDDDQSLPHTSAVQAETMRCIDFTLNFGGHYQSSNHIVFGYSTGIGVRNAHSSRIDIGEVTDGFNNSHYANALQTYDKTKLLFTFQFTVGGWY